MLYGVLATIAVAALSACGSGGKGSSVLTVTSTPYTRQALEIDAAKRLDSLEKLLLVSPHLFSDPGRSASWITGARGALAQGKLREAETAEEQARPKFEGVVSGIWITDDASSRHAWIKAGGQPCVDLSQPNALNPRLQYGIFDPMTDPSGASDLNVRINGTIFDLTSPLLADFKESTVSFLGCDGQIAETGATYYSGRDVVYVSKAKDRATWGMSVSSERLEASTIAGRPAVLVKPFGYHGGHVLVRTDYGLMHLFSTNMTLDRLIPIAESIK